MQYADAQSLSIKGENITSSFSESWLHNYLVKTLNNMLEVEVVANIR